MYSGNGKYAQLCGRVYVVWWTAYTTRLSSVKRTSVEQSVKIRRSCIMFCLNPVLETSAHLRSRSRSTFRVRIIVLVIGAHNGLCRVASVH